MNEQIRQLAIQADIGFDEKYHWYVSNKTLEKFAELIVKDCLEQIDKIRDGLYDDEYEQALGADLAGLAVARHFGVEE